MSSIQLIVDGATVYDSGGIVVVPPIVPPVQPPVQPPHGGGADIVWQPISGVSLFPQPAVQTSSPSGYSIQFMTDAQTRLDFPNGITFRVWDDSGVGQPKELVISATPHNFTPVDADGLSSGIVTPAVNVTLTGVKTANCCNLQPNIPYYINIRAVNPADTIVLQVGAQVRTKSWLSFIGF